MKSHSNDSIIDAVLSNTKIPQLQNLQKLFSSSLDVICSFDKEGRFIDVSAASLRVWGYTPEELQGRRYIEMVLNEDIEHTLKAAADRMSGKDMTNFENRYVRKDNRVIPILWSARWDDKEEIMYCVAKDATEKRRSELLLKEAQRNAEVYADTLNALIENVGDGFYFMDKDFLVCYWNKKAEAFLKKSKQEVVGKNFWDVFPQAKVLRFYEQYTKALNENAPVHFEEYIAPIDAWLDISAYPTEFGLSVFFRSINEKKKREQELKISNERYAIVSEATSDAVWDWDIQTNNIAFNAAFHHLFGYTNSSDQIQKIWTDNIHEDDLQKVTQSLETAIKKTAISQWQYTYRFYKEDRSIAYVLDRGIIIRNKDGVAIRMVGSMQDITKTKEVEIALERKERRFRAMVQSGKDLIALLNRSFQIEYISSNYSIITGYSESELMGLSGHLSVHPDDYQNLMEQAGRILKEETVLLPNYRFKHKDGSYLWLETTLTNHLANPDIKAIVANTRDITKTKNAQEELQRLSLIAKETKNAVIITDPQERIVWVNQAFIEISEYSLDEALGRKPGDLLQGPKTSVRVKKHLKDCIENKKPFTCEILNYSKTGREYWMEIKGQPIFNSGGEVDYFFAIQNDITERVMLHQMIIEEEVAAQKDVAKAIIDTQEKERSEIGKELHDNVNQVLTTIKLYIENIREYPDHSQEFIEKSVKLSQRAINEIRFLAKQLATPVMNDLGFKATIDELVDHYTSLHAFKIHLVFDLDEAKIEKGMKLTIYRIIQEQLNNIVKYAKAARVTIMVFEKGSDLIVAVQDDGIGFDTTKSRSGLGLNNIQNRSEVYKGTLTITSSKDNGCSLTVVFPQNANSERGRMTSNSEL